jgi:hypothetical protein
MSATTQYQVLLPCPVCSGTGRVPITEPRELYEYWSSFDAANKTLACSNCGGQTMHGVATGKTRPRRDTGEPCVHEYTGYQAGRCYYRYTCKHCGDEYGMDSGD